MAAGALQASTAPDRAVDMFAAQLQVDAASLMQDVRAAASFAHNALVLRRENRKDAAAGKRILTDFLPKTEQIVRRVARLDAKEFTRKTVAKTGTAPDETLVDAMIEHARNLGDAIRALQAERDYVRCPAGGGADQDRYCAVLIERLAMIWLRHTNRPAPGGASGPFVNFVAAAWSDLGLSEFTNRKGEAQSLIDAIGNRVVKFHKRQNREKNNKRLSHKQPVPRRA